jgi:hypothetical protein
MVMSETLAHAGFFVSEDELKRVFESNRNLAELSRDELVTGVVGLNFMGAGVYEYLVTKESVFYPYFEVEGRKEIYMF